MKPIQKEDARKMRLRGKSLGDISRVLKISKSTASVWCEDIVLTQNQRDYLKENQKVISLRALSPWILRNKRRKTEDISIQNKKGVDDVGIRTKRDLFILGLGLYWGEGYKKGSQECAFTNSDPAIIRSILEWFRVCYGITNDRIHVSLTINELYRDKESTLIDLWSTETKLQRDQFDKSTFISGYGNSKRNPDTYTGTLRVKVRNGTSLRRRILASIEAIQY